MEYWSSKQLQKGIIYSVTRFVLKGLKYLNLFELFKWSFKKIVSNDDLLGKRLGIDIFIILKWTFVLMILFLNLGNIALKIAVWYLIISNLYTFFYYQVWASRSSNRVFDHHRIRRRFIHLLLAFSFNVICFAYLVTVPYQSEFLWSRTGGNAIDGILFSIANSFTVDYVAVQVQSIKGSEIQIIETLFTFVFLTIILSNSIPDLQGSNN